MEKMNTREAVKIIIVLLIVLLDVSIVFGQTVSPFLTLPFAGDYQSNCQFYCYYYEGSDNPHGAYDYPLPRGTEVLAAADGMATAKTQGANGHMVIIDHGNDQNGNTRRTEYCHLESYASGITENGQAVLVTRGQVIGYSGNSGGPWKQADGNMRSPYHLHFVVKINGIPVDPATPNYLWTTNPPSHASSAPLIPLLFSFPSHSSDGWTCGYDTQTTSDQDPVDQNTWKVAVQGPNPGVVSPELMAGLTTNNLTLRFSAKVRGTGPDTYCQIWIKDDSGSWSHEVRVRSVDGQAGNVVKRDYQYHEYTALLADAGNISIRQFSIELTQEANTYEEWIFDWVELSSGGAGGSPEFTPTILKTLIFPYLRGSLKAEES